MLELVRDDVRWDECVLEARVDEDHRPELLEEQVLLHDMIHAGQVADELL